MELAADQWDVVRDRLDAVKAFLPRIRTTLEKVDEAAQDLPVITDRLLNIETKLRNFIILTSVVVALLAGVLLIVMITQFRALLGWK